MASGAAAGPSPEEREQAGPAPPPSNGSTPTAGQGPAAPAAPAAGPEIRAVGSGVFWVWAASFLAAAVLGIVLIQNTHAVRFRFLWIDAEPPLLAVIVVTALLAAAVSEGVTAVWRHRRRRVRNERAELQRLRRQPPGR